MLTLLWQRRNSWWVWAPTAFFATLLFLFAVSFLFSIPGEICGSHKEGDDGDCHRYNLAYAVLLQLFYWANDLSVAITATATALLTYITVLLWRLEREAGKTTRAQLRAYALMVSANIDHLPDERLVRGVFRIENTGQTPAYHFRARIEFRQGEKNLAAEFAPDEDLDQRSVLARSAHHLVIANLEAPETPLPDGERPNVYVVGRIDYIDAFREEQWSTIRCRVRRDKKTGRYDMYPCREGNDAS